MGANRRIRICVIDDEPIACRKIQGMLKDDPEIELLEVCYNGEQAAEAIHKLHPDLIFLDVQMPGMNGFEVLESIKDSQRMPYVIFVTAYDHYAVRAFEVHAFDYLLKPFDRKRFTEALGRAKAQILANPATSYNQELLSLLKTIQGQNRILHRLVINNRVLKTVEIDWIQAQGKHCLIHAGKDSHLVREGMSDFEAQLDPKRFLRIHKSTIVNVDRIDRVQSLFHGDYQITLRDGTLLIVSRRYRARLIEVFGKPLR